MSDYGAILRKDFYRFHLRGGNGFFAYKADPRVGLRTDLGVRVLPIKNLLLSRTFLPLNLLIK